MTNPDCPTVQHIIMQGNLFHTDRKQRIQRGRGKAHLYQVLVVRQSPTAALLWWSDKLHPHSQQPDFNPRIPMALINPTLAPQLQLWSQLKTRPQLARLLAAAIQRLDACPWPS